METAYDILNKIFPQKVLSKGEYRVARRIIQYFKPDIPFETEDGSKLKAVVDLIGIAGAVLEKNYGYSLEQVFKVNKKLEFSNYRRMTYAALMDVLGVDLYTVQRSFSKYRDRATVYISVKKLRSELEYSLALRKEYDSFKRHIREEYERRNDSTASGTITGNTDIDN